MRRLIKIVSMIAVVALLLTVPVCAEENGGATTWSRYFISWSAYLCERSSTQFDICFDVLACDVMTNLGVSRVKVQRSTDGSTWKTIDTLTPTDYPILMCGFTGMHMDYIIYTATPGYYYRAYVTFYAENSAGGVGVVYAYTDIVRL